jgi:AbrB family looped-hinge helix DNA binding protein
MEVGMFERSIATLSAKFQLSVPKAVREEQGWKAGQKFAFIPKDGGVMLVAVPSREKLRGMFKGADTSEIRDHTDRV